jgi:hypothetical protein
VYKGGVKQWYLVLRFLVVASCRCTWHSFKNCLKVLIGCDTYFDEKGLFLRRYVLHLTGLRPIREITCRGQRNEGAGSQAIMIMNAISFARSFGLTYVHTPFTQIQHAERPMQEWVAAWETLFNLGAGEAVCDIDRHDVIDFCYNFTDLDLCFGWRCRADELGRRFKAMIPEFRRKYYLNKSPHMTDEVTVAVHIRRGDASPDDPSYYTSNETILRTVTSVKTILDTHKAKYRIRFYSQGNCADFVELSLPGIEFFLDVDTVWTMKELIEADVLIMAKGCFSHCAGLISDGIKIGEAMPTSADSLPGWRWPYVSPAECWLTSLADGSFDHAAFERQLSLLIQSKAMAATNASAGGFGQKSNDLE